MFQQVCERFCRIRVTRLNRPGFPGECFICELRLPDHRFRWKHNK
ncbi:oxidoreductase, partial [Escherichia coli]|nr:oxidoreductase [Escherichia coli]